MMGFGLIFILLFAGLIVTFLLARSAVPEMKETPLLGKIGLKANID